MLTSNVTYTNSDESNMTNAATGDVFLPPTDFVGGPATRPPARDG
jgi:hypothetical protein